MIARIAEEAGVKPEQVVAAIGLLDKGSTIPFVARYRKDLTGNLDEVQLETIAERNLYFTSLLQRRDSIIENIRKQDRLTESLEKLLRDCLDKNELEDLYLPYKKARRTKATTAREQGLEPLAEYLWRQESDARTLEQVVEEFISAEKGVLDGATALQGAGFLLAERISLDAVTRTLIRSRLLETGKLHSSPTKLAEEGKTKFETYYDFEEPMKSIPSHRFLAIMRGVREGVLRTEIRMDDDSMVVQIAERYIQVPESAFATPLRSAVEDAFKRLLRPSIDNEVAAIVRKRADEHAIHVFRQNAENLLMVPPAGRIPVIGVDPGLRTGCKLAVIDDTGSVLEHATIFLQASEERVNEARDTLKGLLTNHKVKAVAVGNGTGSREASAFVREVLRDYEDKEAFAVLVNEAGASVYSASKIAREEFPELDVTVRGAISIARRLQDPLSEMVKIDPKNIGVGQYQHDVNQKQLREGLERSIVSCVNRVGVDLNTASVPLLRYVSGIQYGTAQNIVHFRAEHGGFRSRDQLLEVDGIGQRVYEQCAGFLRVRDGEQPLDSTAIHPEAYPLVEEMVVKLEMPVKDVIGDAGKLEPIDWDAFKTEVVGSFSLNDIRDELARPGRDPRRKFQVPRFLDGVVDIKDLEIGMVMQGAVTNVTDFGAFVDIGVHHDGLVHLSEMAARFVRDPQRLVHVGQIVTVKVIKVDKELPRISLSMKAAAAERKAKEQKRGEHPKQERSAEAANGGRERPRHAAKGKNGGPSKKRPKKTKRDSSKSKKPVTSGATAADRMNTQLADQLEMLKKSLGE